MRRMKPYLKGIYDILKSSLMVIALVSLGVQLLNCMIYRVVRHINNEARFAINLEQNTENIFTIFIFVMGILLGSKLFSVFISIRSDRKSYLMSFAVSCVVLCSVSWCIHYSVAVGMEILVTFWLPGLEFEKSTWSVKLLVLAKFFTIEMVGFFLGAFCYRLKILNSVLSFTLLPAFGMSLFIYLAYTEKGLPRALKALIAFINRLYESGSFLLPFMLIGVGVIFYGLGYGLLIKAPIKSYAHDL